MSLAQPVPADPPPGPQPRRSRAAAAIVAANAMTLVMGVVLQWSLGSLIWPYWLQSLVIGFFARRRILALQSFSTEGFYVNDRPVLPTPETRRSTANFFALHYGFFHAVYVVFLVALAPPRAQDLPWFAVALVSFVLGHERSFREHVARDLAGRPNIGTLMFLPYARIVPMHLIIIGGVLWVGAASSRALALFVALKTGADLLMHSVEHRVLGGSGAHLTVRS
jgi:hypothetical protein